MNVLSLFNGMGCIWIALDRLNIKVNRRYASEIDKYCNIVNDHHYPDTIQLGDVVKLRRYLEKPYLYERLLNTSFVKPENKSLVNHCIDIYIEGVDLLVGGSPCQGFSFAGKQLNFNDPRSALFFEFVKIKEILKPKYFLLENVVMKKEYERVITEYMGVDPVMINSALVSAQNRKRLYWSNITAEMPEGKMVSWGDVRERGVNESKYYYTEKAMQWLARHSRKKNKILNIHNDDEKMQMLEASHNKGYSSQRFFGILDIPQDEQCVAAIRGRYIVDGKRNNNGGSIKGISSQFIEFRYDGKTNALTTVGKDNVVVPFTLEGRVPVDEFFFRYITPVECERLQTVPDNFTAMVSNTQRYRMLGNGWTVDVIVNRLKPLKDEYKGY